MAVAVVDTSVLIGVADSDDQNHSVATDIVREMDHGVLPTGHVTNYVVLETLNWIHSRKQHATATTLHTRLNESAGFEIHHAAQKDFTRAVELFETYDTLSFGDTTIVAYMERADIEYLYTFDDDFEAVDGITRLETPDDPFN